MNYSNVTLRQVLEVNLELERERLKETIPEMKRAIELHIKSLEHKLLFDVREFINQLN